MKPIPVFDPAEHASVPLGVGDLIQNNDVRGDVLTTYKVTRFECGGYVYAISPLSSREPRLLVRRVHLDGKPRRSGWSRIAISQG